MNGSVYLEFLKHICNKYPLQKPNIKSKISYCQRVNKRILNITKQI